MKRTEEIVEKVMPYASAAAGQRHLLAMRGAMIRIVPFTLAVSLFVLISRFPWEPYQELMRLILGDGWGRWSCDILVPLMIGIIALLGVVSTAASLSKSYGHDGVEAGILALIVYGILLLPDNGNQVQGLEGAGGLWPAMLVGLGTAELYERFAFLREGNIGKKMPQAFIRSICPMLTVFVVVGIAAGIKIIHNCIFSGMLYENWMDQIRLLLFNAGTSLPGTIFVQSINSLFWGMGLHGAQLVNGAMLPVWMTQTLENLEVFAAGGTIYPHIVTKQFIELFIWIGGSASSLSMVLWIKLFAKSKHVKQVGKMAFLPAIFNIDEPIVFGLPIAFNPVLIIPFILAPVATTVFSYLTMAWGIFPRLCGIDLPWSTPVFISGFLATNGDLRGVLLQLCNLVISFAIYAPFIWTYDRHMMKNEQ